MTSSLRARLGWLVAALSVAIALTSAVILHTKVEITGDEPHYLVIAQSLWLDHDIDLTNDYGQQTYRRFYPHDLDPHAGAYTSSGRLYSGHNVGLAWLLAPFFGLAGVPGAIAVMALLTAGLCCLAYWLARDVGASPAAALAAWAIVTLSLPLILYPSRIFPEVPAGLAIALSLHLLSRPRLTTWRLLLAMLLVAALPWLHAKLLVPAGLLGLLALARIGRWGAGSGFWVLGFGRRKMEEEYRVERVGGRHATRAVRAGPQGLTDGAADASEATLALPVGGGGATPLVAIPLLAIPVLSVAAMSYFFWRWYGSPLPNAQYYGGGIEPGSLRYGLPGLLLDQEFGLLVYAPIYLLAAPGLFLAVQRRDWRTLGPALLGAMIYVISALYPVWWGGYGFPPRFLVPVVVLLAPALALAIAALRRLRPGPVRAAAWAIAGLLGLLTLGQSGIGLARPDLVLNNGWRESQLLVALSPPGVDLPAYFPSFIPDDRVRETPAGAIPGQVGVLVADAAAPGGQVRRATPEGGPGLLVDGLWAMRPRGDGRIAVELRWTGTPAVATNPVARLEYVARANGQATVIATKDIVAADLAGDLGYRLVELPYRNPGFTLLGARPELGVRLHYVGQGTLSVSRVLWRG